MSYGSFFRFLIPSLGLLLGSCGVVPRGWDSGGGAVVNPTSNNPWFLKGVDKVRYCIEIDEANFGLNRKEVREIFQKVLTAWHNEIEDYVAVFPWNRNRFVDLGWATQQFEESDCAESTDLRLQFGVLTSAQLAQLRNPLELIAIAMRTEYDTVKMRGRGFLYVSPGAGPLKYQGKGLVDNAWNQYQGAYLFWVLAHEFGHILGLPHTDRGGLMSERFVDHVLRRGYSYASMLDRFHFLLPLWAFGDGGIYGGCSLESPANYKAFFGVDETLPCIEFEMHHDSIPVYKTNGTGTNSSPKVRIGSIELDWSKVRTQMVYGFHFALPENQSLFPGFGPSIHFNSSTVSIHDEYVPARFVSLVSSSSKTMQVKVSSHHEWNVTLVGDNITFGGEVNGVWFNDLFFGQVPFRK